jgi:isopenicillin-N epimerase
MTLSRRDLLGLAALLPGFSGLAHAAPACPSASGSVPHAPRVDDEAAWERIKAQFVIDGLHLNTGTIGACPLPVLEATIHHLRAFERITTPEHVNMPALHLALERLLGAWPGSVAVVRNTTEAMSIVANGLELAPGDEILTTTHEHIGGRCCWELLSARRGVTLRAFAPPLDPANDDELVAAWAAAIGPRTKVLSISHVLFNTGMLQPAARLVGLARERGIVSVIDGAHPPGMLALDLQALDADYYCASPHKWLLAPKGTGLLVVRPDRIATTWPLIASGNWADPTTARFEHLGTLNESLYAGLAAAIAFHEAIGREAVESRVRALGTQLHDALRATPGSEVVTPRAPAMRTGMVSFRSSRETAEALQGRLSRARIRTRRISEHGLEYLRLSAHVYTVPRDLDRVVGLVAAGG